MKVVTGVQNCDRGENNMRKTEFKHTFDWIFYYVFNGSLFKRVLAYIPVYLMGTFFWSAIYTLYDFDLIFRDRFINTINVFLPSIGVIILLEILVRYLRKKNGFTANEDIRFKVYDIRDLEYTRGGKND